MHPLLSLLLTHVSIFAGIAAIAALLYFWFKLPKSRDASFIEGVVVGHRGCRTQDLMENTISACSHALQFGQVKVIEFDIMLSKEKIPVLFHDTNGVSRVCNTPSFPTERADPFISDLTLGEIKKLRYKHGPENEQIPTFDEFLSFAISKNPDIKFVIESKEHEDNVTMAKEISRAIQKYNLYDRAVVASFDPISLYWVRKIDPKIVTMLFVYKTSLKYWLDTSLKKQPSDTPLWIEKNNKFLRDFGFSRILQIIDWLVLYSCLTWLPSFLGAGVIGFDREDVFENGLVDIKKFQRRGYAVNMWTINDPKEKNALLENGKVAITTDFLFE